MINKRQAAMFVLALVLGLGGQAAWKHWAAPSSDASAPTPGLTPPDPNDKGLIGSLFSRPTVTYTPVNIPAPPSTENASLDDRTAASASRELPSAGGRVGLGDSSDLGGAARTAPPSAPLPAVAPQWQMPSDSTPSRGPSTSVGPPPDAGVHSHLSSPTLQRLKRKVGHPDRAVVNLSGVPDRVSNAIPTPTASPLSPYPSAGGDNPPTVAAAGAAGAAVAPAADAPLGSASASAAPGDANIAGDSNAAAAPADAPAVADPTATVAASTDTTDDSIADMTPVIGAPQLDGNPGVVVKPSGFFFAAKKGAGATVQPLIVTVGKAKAIEYTSAMRVDADGAGGWSKKDKAGHPTTTLKYSPTESLDPGQIPYVTLPKGFNKDFPGVHLGDYAAVTYGGRTLYAIVGDIGLPGILGAGSIALASGLGIDPDPKTGGAASGVTYVILAGSRSAAPARDAATIQNEGARVFAAAGIQLQ
jgi:hypothetical protein